MDKNPAYISSREGAQLLNMSRQMFFYYVNRGKIRKITGEKRGSNIYNLEDILHLKTELGRAEPEPLPITIDWVKVTDLPNTLALDIQVYDEPVIGDISLYVSWLRCNPHLTLAAFEGNNRDKVLAYINLLPLEEPIILDILKRDRDEKSIQPQEIEDYSREGDYFLLAESVVTLSGHQEHISQLMRAIAAYWCEQWPQHRLCKIYAQAVSKEGLFLVQKMFFAPMDGYPEDAYVLDLHRKNPSRFVRAFQGCIAEKEAQMLEQQRQEAV